MLASPHRPAIRAGRSSRARPSWRRSRKRPSAPAATSRGRNAGAAIACAPSASSCGWASRPAPTIEAVCGPFVEGAYVARMVASELGVPFSYAERFPNPGTDALFPIDYRVPRALRAEVRDKRVAIVNDVINAGSAVRGTLTDLAA